MFILTDIGNEPDDQTSFVCLLLYSNELDIEGTAAVASNHLTDQLNPHILREVVQACDNHSVMYALRSFLLSVTQEKF